MFALAGRAPHRVRESRAAAPQRASQLPQRSAHGGSGSAEQARALQRTIGNQAVRRLLAEMRHGLPGNDSAEPRIGPPEAAHVIQQVLRSPGQPLPSETQRDMFAAFGEDFSSVRIHADVPAAASARALRADAYTAGSHIAFAPGRYQPGNAAGMRLLAHELAHVVQQRVGGAAPGAAQEQDAEAASGAVVAGEAPRVRAPSQVGIAAQPEQASAASAKSPFETVMWFTASTSTGWDTATQLPGRTQGG